MVTAVSKAGGPSPHHPGEGGYSAGTSGSTTTVAPCPNIPPGRLCLWAPRLAAPGWARRQGGRGGCRRPRVLGGPVVALHPPARACARRVLLYTSPHALRAAPPCGQRCWPSPPPRCPLLLPWGGRGALLGRPGEGGGGAGGLPPHDRVAPVPRRPRSPRPLSAPPPSPCPPAARAGCCPPCRWVLGGSGRGTVACSRAGTRRIIRCEWHDFVVVLLGRRRPTAGGWTVHPGARSDWASHVLLGSPEGLLVREGRVALGQVRRHPGGRGHGPPEVRHPAGPDGWVAPGLCAAPKIPALGGRGARPRAKPAAPPWCPVQAPGGGRGGLGLEGGGGVGGD